MARSHTATDVSSAMEARNENLTAVDGVDGGASNEQCLIMWHFINTIEAERHVG